MPDALHRTVSSRLGMRTVVVGAQYVSHAHISLLPKVCTQGCNQNDAASTNETWHVPYML